MTKKKQPRRSKEETPKPQKRLRWRQNIDDEIEALGDKVTAREKRQREKDEDK